MTSTMPADPLRPEREAMRAHGRVTVPPIHPFQEPDMDTETDTIIPPGSEAPEDQAREAAEAMRARGADRPDVERVLIHGAERHAWFVERNGLAFDWDAGAVAF